jgi:ferredoxin-NADP reductase
MSSSQSRSRFYVELIEKKRESASLLHLVFSATRNFDFTPGQFVTLRKPRGEGEFGRPRCYSLASRVEESRERGLLEFCVALRENLSPSEQKYSFPCFLEGLSLGQRLECSGPFGSFVWSESMLAKIQLTFPRLERVCWIGAGSGIAPLRSMILSEFGPTSAALPHSALLHGARDFEQLIYARDFQATPGLEYFPCLSRQSRPGAGFFQGRVTDQLRVLARTWDFSRTVFLVCGSHALVNDVRRILTQEFRSPEALIFTEGFGEASNNDLKAA